MARYERDYGRDFGRYNGPVGGMRSDAFGGTDWQNFPGSEGWYGEGYGGAPSSYGRGYPGEWEGRGRGFEGGQAGGYGQQSMDGYGFDRGARGGYGDRGYGQAGGYGQGGYGQEFNRGGYGGGQGEWQDRGWGNRDRGGNRLRAADLMTENPEAVTPDAQISDVAKKMRDFDVGIIPVVESLDSRRLRGVITDRDIAVRAVAEGREGTTRIEECMTQRVRTVNKNDSVEEVMRVMREEQVRRVPVTDREGRLVGIIAQADLAVDLDGREREVGETVEQISEPARPHRGGSRTFEGGSQ